MSTRSIIALRLKNRTTKAIYCHFDGYPEHMAPTLLNFYKNIEKVKDLLNLGSFSYLEDTILETKKQSYIFKGEPVEYNEAKKFNCDKDLLDFARDCMGEYIYVFDELDNDWFMYDLWKNSSETLLRQIISQN